MMTQTTSYDHHTDHDHIDCEQQGVAEPYPVLHLGNTTIWPTREQLVAIRDAIQGYLDAHPITVEALTAQQASELAADLMKETPMPGVAEYTDAEIREMF